MKFFDKLERRFGEYAIPNLMYYIIGIYLVGFVIELFAPDVYTYYLSLVMRQRYCMVRYGDWLRLFCSHRQAALFLWYLHYIFIM